MINVALLNTHDFSENQDSKCQHFGTFIFSLNANETIGIQTHRCSKCGLNEVWINGIPINEFDFIRDYYGNGNGNTWQI